jgi:hypothetical protein
MFEPFLDFFASIKALVAVLLASNILPIIGANDPKSLATLLAFFTIEMADCIPASAVIGSIIFSSSTLNKLPFDYTHLQTMPIVRTHILWV